MKYKYDNTLRLENIVYSRAAIHFNGEKATVLVMEDDNTGFVIASFNNSVFDNALFESDYKKAWKKYCTIITEESNEDLLNILKKLPLEHRKKVLEKFCQRCSEECGLDWSGSNYCDRCSPDPPRDW